MARYCNKCNYPIEEGGAFCSECGSSDIRDESQLAATTPEVTTPETEPVPETIPEVTTPESEPVSETTPSPIPEITTDPSGAIPEIVPVTTPEATTPAQHEPIDAPVVTEIPKDINNTQPETEPPSSGHSFADVPDYMGGSDNSGPDIPVEPTDLKNMGVTTPKPTSTNSSSQNVTIRRNHTYRRKNSNNNIFLVVGAVLAIFVVISLGGFFLYGKNFFQQPVDGSAVIDGPFDNNDLNSTGNMQTPTDFSKIFTPENSWRVGHADYGFISIPNTWVKFTDIDGNTTLQFTDNGTWIVTIYGISTEKISAVQWANNVYNDMKSKNCKNLSTTTTTIDNYTALTINAYYETQGKYLTAWFLESKSGITHYLALEGPANTGDNFNIIYSFRDDQ